MSLNPAGGKMIQELTAIANNTAGHTHQEKNDVVHMLVKSINNPKSQKKMNKKRKRYSDRYMKTPPLRSSSSSSSSSLSSSSLSSLDVEVTKQKRTTKPKSQPVEQHGTSLMDLLNMNVHQLDELIGQVNAKIDCLNQEHAILVNIRNMKVPQQ